MKTKFEQFINEQYTLTIEDSMDDFEIQEPKWEMEYDVSDIWKEYRQNDDFENFIKKYKNILLSKKDKLVEVGNTCWNDLVKLIKEKPDENKYFYLDKIYDWADKYAIKINVKK